MASDFQEQDRPADTKEATDQGLPAGSKHGLSDSGVARMQEPAEMAGPAGGNAPGDGPEVPGDRTFVDREGRNIALRTYDNGDQHFIRAYDTAVKTPPERADTGQAGYANVLIEQGKDGQRARLQDIGTTPAYEGSGVGSQMLSQAETVGRQHGAREIYGLAPSETQTRQWYRKRGYNYRNVNRSEEVFKLLN